MKTMDYDKAVTDGFIKVIGKEIDDAYIAELKKQNIHPEAITKVAKDIKIVYTPLHGQEIFLYEECLQNLALKMSML